MKVIKYTCPGCQLEVWTRAVPRTSLICTDCLLQGIVATQSDGPGLYHGPWPVLVPSVDVDATEDGSLAASPVQAELVRDQDMLNHVWTRPHQRLHIWERVTRHLNDQKLGQNLGSQA